jgi:hypothetical protein
VTLGATHYRWRPDVRRIVQLTESRFSRVKANTYVAHPWPGWSYVSVDWWARRGRGYPIERDVGEQLLAYLLNLPGLPPLRHYIWQHTLWTSWGGKSLWRPDDHSGRLRHLHMTFWR